MDTDDFSPPGGTPSPTAARFADITRMSVNELRDYRLALEAEIARVDAATRAKQASIDAAALFFKK